MDIADPSTAPPPQNDHWSLRLFGTWSGRLVWIVLGLSILLAAKQVSPSWLTWAIFAVWSFPLLIASVANTLSAVLVAIVAIDFKPKPVRKLLLVALDSALEEGFVVLAIVVAAVLLL